MSFSASLDYITDESHREGSCSRKSGNLEIIVPDADHGLPQIINEGKMHIPRIGNEILDYREVIDCLPSYSVDEQNSKIIADTDEKSEKNFEYPVLASPTLSLHIVSEIKNDNEDYAACGKSSENAYWYKTYPLENKYIDIINIRKKSSSDSTFFENIFTKEKTEDFELPKSNSPKTNFMEKHLETNSISPEQDATLEKKNNSFTFSKFASKARLSPSKAKTGEQQIELKTKIRSVWNNMKYGWRLKREVKLKVDSPVWLLGQYYHAKLKDVPYNNPTVGSNAVSVEDIAKVLFKQDVTSRIWLTYRMNFPKIAGSDYATDTGWGCMLRAGQMMMAQALICHFLSRAWRLSCVQTETTNTLHRMIIRWFGDSPSPNSPFSIHHLVCLGKMYGRKIGDWYGPTHAAHVLRKALIQARNNDSKLDNICMYAASDGIVFKQDVVDLCVNPLQSSPDVSSEEYSYLSTRFTVDKQNNLDSNSYEKCREPSISDSKPIQEECGVESEHNAECIPSKRLKNTRTDNINSECYLYPRLRHISDCEEVSEEVINDAKSLPINNYVSDSSLPLNVEWRSLILFVSVRLGNDKINPFYIPSLKSLLAYEHCIGIIGGRPKHAVYFIGWQGEKLIHLDPHACQPAVDVETDDFNEKSFHSSSVCTMSFTDMDPSCAIGFYFKTRDEFEYFCEKISEIASPLKNSIDYPLFALAEGRRVEVEERNSKHCSQAFQPLCNLRNGSYKEDDDYILL